MPTLNKAYLFLSSSNMKGKYRGIFGLNIFT